MSLSLLLRCNSRRESRNFYTSILGFVASDTVDDTLTVERDGDGLIFTELDLWHSAPMCSGTIYFAVADVDDYYLAIKDKAPIAWPLQDMPYGTREFAVTDCNGYIIAFQRDH
jgi:uncharacterized glyoxalase superfamily protein PhnB